MENNVSGVPLRKSCALYVVMLAVWTVLTVLLWRQYVPVIISPQFTGGAGTAVFIIDLVCTFLFIAAACAFNYRACRRGRRTVEDGMRRL